jgi:hypothetical protein
LSVDSNERAGADEGRRSERVGAGVPPARRRRALRRALLVAIALLYVASIPWYRTDASAALLFGLPDWVAIAILCYAGAAALNALAWLVTEIPEAQEWREGQGP